MQEFAVAVPLIDSLLESADGLLVRERFNWSQIAFDVCERRVQFKVAIWDRKDNDHITDEDFLSKQPVLEVIEESDWMQRYLCRSFRALDLGVFLPQNTAQSMDYAPRGWPADQDPLLTLEKPFRCSACCVGCWVPWPAELSIRDARGVRGAVRSWKYCIPCHMYAHAYDESGNVRYVLHTPMCCGSSSQNCCAPSCCNAVHTTWVLDPSATRKLGSVETHWAGWNVRGALSRRAGANNFVLKFPESASVGDKTLILGAWALHNFILWEGSRDKQNRNRSRH